MGEPVPLVIAETHGQALDAADQVDVTYGSPQAVTTPEEALSGIAPVIAPGVDRNLCLDVKAGDEIAVDAAFLRAAHVVEFALDNHRIVTNPMEPRGAAGIGGGENTRHVLHISTQNLHAVRYVTARSLGVEAQAVQFVAPDVGGGFGTKNFGYIEYPLLAWAVRLWNRPVKWIASRSEVLLTDHQARDHRSISRLALYNQGRFLALKVESVANLGAYLIGSMGVVETALYAYLPGAV